MTALQLLLLNSIMAGIVGVIAYLMSHGDKKKITLAIF